MTRMVIMAAILSLAESTLATTVEISVATDKPTYQLGETVNVSVIAHNPNPQPVTLSFGNSLNAKYLMDNVFDWTQGKVFIQIVTEVTIGSGDSHVWNLKHGSSERAIYPLNCGTHTIVGEVVGYGQTSPIMFEVVPEPATAALLAAGALMTFAKRKNQRIICTEAIK